MSLHWCFPIHFKVSVVSTRDFFLVLALSGLRTQIISCNTNSIATFKKKSLSGGSTVDTQKTKRRESKHNAMEKSSIHKEDSKRIKEQENYQTAREQ